MFSVNYHYNFFVKQDKRVKSRFWLFNLCNSGKKLQNRKDFEKMCSVFCVSFCSASAKNSHFGASLYITIYI